MDLSDSFTWTEYLEKTGSKPAEAKCFKQSRTPPTNSFKVDELLEAEDQRIAISETPPLPDGHLNSPLGGAQSSSILRRRQRRLSLMPAVSTPAIGDAATAESTPASSVRRLRAATFSLARVVESSGPRIRVRMVGTDDRNDCWFLVDSDQIRPFPSGEALQPPFGYVHDHLTWHKTLKKTADEGFAADSSSFAPPPDDPPGNLFKEGDKLEAVDHRNAQLICPATIGFVVGEHVLISFDGWSGAFDYWSRFDSRDLFPVGWSKRAGYPLQFPGPQATRHLNLSSSPSPVKPSKTVKRIPPGASAHINRRRSTITKRRSAKTIAAARKRAATTIPKLKVFTGPSPPLKTIIKMENSSASSFSDGFSSPPVISREMGESDQGDEEQEEVGLEKKEGFHESYKSPSSLSVPPSSHYLSHPVEMRSYSEEKRRKKEKKHRRHSSKEHRRSSKEHITLSSVPDYNQPTKLVIRQCSSDRSVASVHTGDAPQKLFVNTKPFYHHHHHSHHRDFEEEDEENMEDDYPQQSTQPLVIKCPAGVLPQQAPGGGGGVEGEDVTDGSTPSSFVSRHRNEGEYGAALCNPRMASSTVSPSSMDLGPCPLPSPASWTVDEVYNYLISKDPSLSEVAAIFKEHEFDGQALLLLNMESLRAFVGLKLGPSLKLDNLINHLKRGVL